METWKGIKATTQKELADGLAPLLFDLRDPARIFVQLRPAGRMDLTCLEYPLWRLIFNALEGCGDSQRGIGGQTSPNTHAKRVELVLLYSGPETDPEWIRRLEAECRYCGVRCKRMESQDDWNT